MHGNQLNDPDRIFQLLKSLFFVHFQDDESGKSQQNALLVFRNLCCDRGSLVELSQSDYKRKFLVKLTDELS